MLIVMNKFKIMNLIFLCLVFDVFFLVFDGFRGLNFPNYFPFSFIRDILIFLPFFFIIPKIIKKDMLTKQAIVIYSLILFVLIYTFFTSLLITIDNEQLASLRGSYGTPIIDIYGLGIGRWTKFFSMFAISITAYYLLLNDEQGYYRGKLFDYYINFSFLYSILTILIYFLLPSVYETVGNNWSGRISIGYPTMDIYFLSCSLILLKYSNFRKVRKLGFSIIIIICLLLQNTTTGFILLFLILFAYIITSKFSVKILSLTTGIFLTYLISYIYYNYTDFDPIGTLLKLKLDSLLSFDTQSDPSYYIRLNQSNAMLQYLFSDSFTFLFGWGGMGSEATEINIYCILGFSGLIGLIVYILISIFVLLKSIIFRNEILFFLIISFWITSISINPVYLYPAYWMFAFCIAYALTLKNQR